MNQAIYLELPDVEARLMELGLCVDDLHAAIKYSELHRSSCTANDPPCLSGLLTWGKTVRGLRDTLTPKGWGNSDENNLSVTIHPNGTLAIAVATGDNGTGNPRLTPETKYPKGPATAAAIEQNIVQLAQPSFSFIETPRISPPQEHSVYTWLFLVSRRRDEVRSELSLPKLITDSGHVVDWEERILLPSIPLEDGAGLYFYEEDNPGDDIVVEISRR
ncbi:hypothetical protein KP005_00220 [Geomonas nitrogeniifigens]|uniref:Uncharacterized protein n=1 Tax=Geomonas diazotrophica TaxID=2843197 RepID=A0ABX8JHG2_9BACT|nr:hypothetical protein [Geomonas nitrogeniifigens]QWV97758.1 hypothetical protein KP005_00220 [Geomonas nitrogeniifigens]